MDIDEIQRRLASGKPMTPEERSEALRALGLPGGHPKGLHPIVPPGEKASEASGPAASPWTCCLDCQHAVWVDSQDYGRQAFCRVMGRYSSAERVPGSATSWCSGYEARPPGAPELPPQRCTDADLDQLARLASMEREDNPDPNPWHHASPRPAWLISMMTALRRLPQDQLVAVLDYLGHLVPNSYGLDEAAPGPDAKNSQLLASLAAARAKSSERAPRPAPAPTLAPRPSQQLQLWPEAVRAVPNGFLRSALFGATARGARRYIDGEDIAAIDGVVIRYKGQRLDQGDLDVWESVLHAVRAQALGSKCRVTSYHLLKLMGKKDTGGNRVTLHKCIERLRANAVTVKQGRYTYIGGLLDEAYRDEVTQEWAIVINPKLSQLFAADQYTQVDWAVRRSLNGHQLAQWLHGFYASHAKPFPLKVETLHRLCGSEAGLMSDFAKKLRKALDAVAEASEAHGEGFSYEIRGGLVLVEKKPSSPQRRHLAKKAAKLRKPRG